MDFIIQKHFSYIIPWGFDSLAESYITGYLERKNSFVLHTLPYSDFRKI